MAALAITSSALCSSCDCVSRGALRHPRQLDRHVSSLDTSFIPQGIATSIRRIPRKKKQRKFQVNAAKISIPNHGYDYYELLGVDPGASTVQIKQSYRWLQKRCHPDVAGKVGHDMSILLNEAYSTLIDLNARMMYDQVRQCGYQAWPCVLYLHFFTNVGHTSESLSEGVAFDDFCSMREGKRIVANKPPSVPQPTSCPAFGSSPCSPPMRIPFFRSV